MFKKLKLSHQQEKKKDVELTGPIIVEEIPILETESKENEEPSTGKKQKALLSERPPKDYQFRFEPNRKYFTISVYALAALAIGMVIIQCILNVPNFVVAMNQFLLIIQPFVVAFFIAFIINPIVKFLAEQFYYKTCHIKSHKICLGLGILTAYVIVIGLLVIFSIYVIPQISNSIRDLTIKLPDLYNEIFNFLNTLETRFPTFDFHWVEEKLQESMPEIISFGTNIVANIIPKILDLSISIARLAINLLLSIAISIYMLYDKRNLSKNATRVIYAMIPKKKAESILSVTKDCGNIFTGFIVGKTVDSTIIGILCFIIMSILRLDYAVLLSVIVGVTNMIPYFGPFIGAIPGVILYLCIDPLQALIFALMILVLQQFDGWVLGPKILGDSTGLTPVWVIFGITVGGAYGGVFGMFLGVPIIAVVSYLADLFITHRLKKKRLDIQ